jgi:hypothetical protein
VLTNENKYLWTLSIIGGRPLPLSHGGNAGSNPAGDAKIFQALTRRFVVAL